MTQTSAPIEEKKTSPLTDALREKARVSQDHSVSTVLGVIADTIDEVNNPKKDETKFNIPA